MSHLRPPPPGKPSRGRFELRRFFKSRFFELCSLLRYRRAGGGRQRAAADTDPRHEVTESDGRHGDEDEVEGLEESPALLDAEHDSADDDVHDQYDERHGHGKVELVVDRVHAERGRAGRRRRETRRAVRHGGVEHGAGPPELGDVVHHLHAFHDLLRRRKNRSKPMVATRESGKNK